VDERSRAQISLAPYYNMFFLKKNENLSWKWKKNLGPKLWYFERCSYRMMTFGQISSHCWMVVRWQPTINTLRTLSPPGLGGTHDSHLDKSRSTSCIILKDHLETSKGGPIRFSLISPFFARSTWATWQI